jgi:penicillin-binding protein 1A
MSLSGQGREVEHASGSRGPRLSSLGRVVPGSLNGAPETQSLWTRLPKRLRWAIAVPAVLGSVTAVAIAGLMIYYTISFPDPVSIRRTAADYAPSVRILARDGSVLSERGSAHQYMPIAMLPKRVTDAVVATEDRRFYSHWGIDPSGMLRAAFANLRAGRVAQGGSTLTQQLAKNMFLSPERTMSRKLEEFVLALWLEVRLSKDEILELYLNRVYFGGGAYGIEAAAQRYFDKSARELSLAEAAVIAGLLKAPSKYAPSASPTLAVARGKTVLLKMYEHGVISKGEQLRAAAEPVKFVDGKGKKPDSANDYAVDYILENMPPLAGSGQSEIVVETTIDRDLQRRAAEIVARELKAQGSVLKASQAALIILDTDGGIRAMVGGRDYTQSQFNRATKARRQPGSAFKPFVYMTALEAGFTADSLIYDAPLTIGEWSPRNDNGKYLGPVTMRQALAQSINSVAVRLMLETSAEKVAAMANRLGIVSELRPDPSMALGTSEVSLTEMTGAFTTFANGGRSVEPHAIRRVRMSSGRMLYTRAAPGDVQALDPHHVAAINDMLHAGMTWGTGRRAAIPGHMAGGKTGTTQDFRDAWFVGYTAHLAGGVWAGNDNGQPMNHVMGGGLPATIWQQVMRVAHEGKASLSLPGIGDGVPVPPGADVMAAAGHAAGASNEILPWMTETSGLPGVSHPKSGIDPALFSRALDGYPGATGTLEQADTAPLPWNPYQTEDGPSPPPSRIVVQPPGRMSLGGPLDE